MNEQISNGGDSLLSISEVAAWQVDIALPCAKAGDPGICAVLPALQRGSVWKPQQTERLWDSMLRGFPVGAFLFSPFDDEANKKYGQRKFKLDQVTSNIQKPDKQSTHYLLDGQQRATTIALGFHDIWETEYLESRKDGPVLWIDLADEPTEDGCEYLLRLITRSHPWGYKGTNSEERLEARDMRSAFENYKKVAPKNLQSLNPAQFPLQHVWPWEAGAPIPLAFIIKSVRSKKTDIAKEVRKELCRLPYWIESKDGPAKMKNGKSFCNTLLAALDGTNPVLKQRFDQIVDSVRTLVAENSRYGIPALMLPPTFKELVEKKGQTLKIDQPVKEKQDSVETLFVRVNAGGTRLEGEELIYSLLKSAWKDAPQAIEKLQPNGHHLLTPARMVTLITRVLLAREQKLDVNNNYPAPPPALEVIRFRRLIREDEFRGKMKAFIGGPASNIIDIAYRLLSLDLEDPSTDQYRLPPSLVAKLTQGETGADVMLLLLRWLDMMTAAKLDPLALTNNQRCLLLGFLTALSWFSVDASRCLRRLWPALQKCPPEKLKNFFNETRFALLRPADPVKGFVMLPIIPPSVLEELVKCRVTNGRGPYGGFGKRGHSFWGTGNWKHYQVLVTDEFKSLPLELKRWLRNVPLQSKTLIPNAADAEDRDAMLLAAWGDFLGRIWSDRNLLQYAQRDWLIKWFPQFDPTLPDQMEDINRPWDYDHIHAYNFIKGKQDIPSVIKDWHSSMGNLRAWPMELNRADQDGAPHLKLNPVSIPIAETRYQIANVKSLRVASFISDLAWNKWENSVPNDPGRYLAKPKDDTEHYCRMNAVNAITLRFCEIYREWHTALRLNGLH